MKKTKQETLDYNFEEFKAGRDFPGFTIMASIDVEDEPDVFNRHVEIHLALNEDGSFNEKGGGGIRIVSHMLDRSGSPS